MLLLNLERALQIDDKTGNAMSTLRQTYQKHLLPYEAYCQQRMDPEADKKKNGKRATTSDGGSRFNAFLAVVDDATEAAEILGSLMSFDRAGSAEGDEPPFKRLKSEEVKAEVRSRFSFILKVCSTFCCEEGVRVTPPPDPGAGC